MIWYLLGINIFSFIIYGVDKLLAVKKLFRVSEYSLFILAIFGGGIGSLLGMKVFHHKTKKKVFWIINIIASIIWIIIMVKN